MRVPVVMVVMLASMSGSVSFHEPGQVHGSFRISGFPVRVVLLKVDVNGRYLECQSQERIMVMDRLPSEGYIKSRYLKVEERLFHLSFVRDEALVSCSIRRCSILCMSRLEKKLVSPETSWTRPQFPRQASDLYLHIAVSLEVENCEAADVSDSIHMDRELSEKIDNLFAAVRQAETEYQRSQDQTHEFQQEQHCLILEQ
jgi:hypothetical protein